MCLWGANSSWRVKGRFLQAHTRLGQEYSYNEINQITCRNPRGKPRSFNRVHQLRVQGEISFSGGNCGTTLCEIETQALSR
jgi:hypothetical protein